MQVSRPEIVLEYDLDASFFEIYSVSAFTEHFETRLIFDIPVSMPESGELIPDGVCDLYCMSEISLARDLLKEQEGRRQRGHLCFTKQADRKRTVTGKEG